MFAGPASQRLAEATMAIMIRIADIACLDFSAGKGRAIHGSDGHTKVESRICATLPGDQRGDQSRASKRMTMTQDASGHLGMLQGPSGRLTTLHDASQRFRCSRTPQDPSRRLTMLHNASGRLRTLQDASE